jgi:hypothetical protein
VRRCSVVRRLVLLEDREGFKVAKGVCGARRLVLGKLVQGCVGDQLIPSCGVYPIDGGKTEHFPGSFALISGVMPSKIADMLVRSFMISICGLQAKFSTGRFVVAKGFGGARRLGLGKLVEEGGTKSPVPRCGSDQLVPSCSKCPADGGKTEHFKSAEGARLP